MEIKVLEKFSTVHDLELFTGFYVDKIIWHDKKHNMRINLCCATNTVGCAIKDLWGLWANS